MMYRSIVRPFCRLFWGATLLLTVSACESANQQAEVMEEDKKIDLTTDMQRASYALGFNQTGSLKSQTAGVIDLDAFLAGVQDAIAGAEQQVPEEEVQALMQAFGAAVQAKQQEASAALNEEADAFRAAFAAEEGVVTLPSGLMYQVITAGDGPKPSATDTVVTHYHGTLINGDVFDSSVDRGQPASFAVNRVIPGWTEALQLMGVGSKWKLVIPPDLAYGARGAGPKIGPNSTLIFEVELLEIQAAQE